MNPLGDDLLPLLLLAIGGALFVGTVLAFIRPPVSPDETAARPPVARSVVMAGIGLMASIWAIASLVS